MPLHYATETVGAGNFNTWGLWKECAGHILYCHSKLQGMLQGA